MSIMNEKLVSLMQHCRQLMDLYSKTQIEMRKIEEENNAFKSIIAENEKIIVNLKEQLTTQNIAVSVADDQDNDSMKRKLNEYIKEIDQCLALLNN